MDPGPLNPWTAFPKMMPSLGLQLLTESNGSQGRVSGPRVSLQPGYGSRLGYAAAQWSFPQAPELTASQQTHHPLTHAPASSLPVPSTCPSSPPLPGPETGKPLSPSSLHCTHTGEGGPPLCLQLLFVLNVPASSRDASSCLDSWMSSY